VKERTAIGEQILKHWRENRPQMVSDLEKINRLEEAVLEAQELTGDLLYDLVSVQKMDYHAAWELATKDWAFLPSEARPRRGSAGKPSTGKSTSGKSSRSRHRRPRRGTSA